MTAVVYGDVIQMIMLFGGTLVAFFVAADQAGGVHQVMEVFPPERASALDLQWGASEEQRSTSFWAFNFGSIILWTHYYGTEQQPAQRILCAKDLDNARGALLFNGLARFPLTLLYALLGIALRGLAQVDDEYLSAVCDPPSAESSSRFENCDADELFPQFIKLRVGDGTRGLLCAAILSAALSSLNSALNSLSAAVSRDFVENTKWYKKKMRSIEEEARLDNEGDDGIALKKQSFILYLNKFVTFIMAVVTTGFAFVLPGISDTVSESANLIGSAFYGSMLAVYVLGIFDAKVDSFSIWVGVIVGVGTNLILFAIYQDEVLFWMWWNVIGFSLTYTLGKVMTHLRVVRDPTEAVWNSMTCCFKGSCSDEDVTVTKDLLEKDSTPQSQSMEQQFNLSYSSIKGTGWERWWPAYVALAGYYVLIFIGLLVVTLQYSDGVHY
jgi:Na+/proline symporter